MAFGMMAPMKGKMPMKKGPGNPKNTKGGKGAMSMKGNDAKMPGAKQAMEYTKKPAPSDVGERAQKMLPPKGKGRMMRGKGK